jgi:hypothetical protein
MASWVSTAMRIYGEKRHGSRGPGRVASVSPGFIFRSDWQSTDRIELAYTRLFYNRTVDANPAAPLDRDAVTLGAIMSF